MALLGLYVAAANLAYPTLTTLQVAYSSLWLNTMGNYLPNIMYAGSQGAWHTVASLIVMFALNMVYVLALAMGWLGGALFLGQQLPKFTGPVQLAVQGAIVAGLLIFHTVSLSTAGCI